jgi:valyl-tRNA synthetase
VVWWRELSLPIRIIVSRNGWLTPLDFAHVPTASPECAQQTYDRLVGVIVDAARDAIVEDLVAEGSLLHAPRPIVHPVKFYEKDNRPLEIVSSRQWFIRKLAHRDELCDLVPGAWRRRALRAADRSGGRVRSCRWRRCRPRR